MSKLKTMLYMIKTPSRLFYAFGRNGFLNWVPDRLYLKILYYLETGEHLNLKNPRTFTEKIQWLKLNDRKNRYIQLIDKYLAKEYVASIIGDEYIVKTLGVWNKPDEIDFDMLPEQFVLKCNHGSGGSGVIICRDKNSFDQNAARTLLGKVMKKDTYSSGREWPYKKIIRKIIAENYISDSQQKDLIDYKFYCFNGQPKYCQVIKGRNTNETIDFYDLEWNLQEFNGLYGYSHGIYSHGSLTEKPKNYDKMIRIAKKLSEGTKFVRIDLYNIDGHIYFGEFTLYPKSGLGKFNPDIWDLTLGELLKL